MHLLRERCLIYQEAPGDYVELSSRALQDLMGRDAYTWAKAALLEAGIIQCDDRYSYNHKGAECLGFRFHPDIADLPAETKELSGLAGLRFRNKREAIAENLAQRSPEAALIRANLKRLSLHPSHVEVLPDFAASIAALGMQRNKRARELLHAERWRQAAWELALISIRSQSFFFTQDKNTGRIYNAFTSMPKELRRYILLDGKPAAEVDITNSQPLLLWTFYPAGSIEGVRYRRLAEDGRVYEELMRAAGLEQTDENRGRFKKNLFAQVFFGKNRDYFQALQLFRRVFPELAAIIWAIKAEGGRDGYKQLAMRLQKLEAGIMINRVIPRLATMLPGVPFLTVHDSLVIPEQYAEDARAIIREEVKAATGLVPSLRITESKIRH